MPPTPRKRPAPFQDHVSRCAIDRHEWPFDGSVRTSRQSWETDRDRGCESIDVSANQVIPSHPGYLISSSIQAAPRGLSVIGAVVGEFIIGSGNSQGGLSVQIIFAQGRMYTSLLFAEVISATVLGFLFFTAISLTGHVPLKHWHELVTTN